MNWARQAYMDSELYFNVCSIYTLFTVSLNILLFSTV